MLALQQPSRVSTMCVPGITLCLNHIEFTKFPDHAQVAQYDKLALRDEGVENKRQFAARLRGVLEAKVNDPEFDLFVARLKRLKFNE